MPPVPKSLRRRAKGEHARRRCATWRTRSKVCSIIGARKHCDSSLQMLKRPWSRCHEAARAARQSACFSHAVRRGARHAVSTSLSKTFHDRRIEMGHYRVVIRADAAADNDVLCCCHDWLSCPGGGSMPSDLTIIYAGVFRSGAAIIPKSLPIRARRGRFFGRFNLRVTASVAGRS